MEIDLVRKSGKAGRVSRRHIVDLHRTAIGPDDPLPYDQSAPLAECDDAVVRTDQARALRNEQYPSGRAVIDAFGDLRGHEPRQVRSQSGAQAGRNDRTGGQGVGRDRPRHRSTVQLAPPVDRAEKVVLAPLAVRITVRIGDGRLGVRSRRQSGRNWYRSDRSRSGSRLKHQTGLAGGLQLGGATIALHLRGIDTGRGSGRERRLARKITLAIEDWFAEVAGKGRPEFRGVSLVLGQPVDRIGRWLR